MSLQIWLPLNKDLHNQGLRNITITNNNTTIQNDGKIGKCYCPATITLTNLGDLSFNESSYCFWAKTSATTSWQLIVGIDNTNLSQIHGIYVADSNRYKLEYSPSLNASNVEINKWHHYAFVIKNGESKVYYDGILKETSVETVTDDTIGRLRIGVGTAISLNDLRIYDHALNEKEVKKIAEGLILHYKLDNNGLGKENHLTNSSLRSKINNFPSVSSSYTQTFEKNDGYDCFHIHSDNFGITSSIGWGVTSIINSYPVGTKFTASGWIKTENIIKGSTNYLCRYYYGGSYDNNGTSTWIGEGTRTENISADAFTRSGTGWTYCYITSTFKRNDLTGMGFYYYLRDFKGDIYLRDFKFEVGDKPTAWCPAKSDLGDMATILHDSSGYNNNGTIIGPLETITPSPKYNYTTKFDGNTSCIQVPYKEINPDGIFTLNLWFFKDALGSKNYETLFGGPSGFEMDTRAGASTTLSLYMASTRGGNMFSPFSLNTWYMVTLVRDGTNEFYYINGELKNTIEAKPMPSGQYRIGAWASDTGQNYYGNISDFRIYATALTAEQVKELYNNSMIVNGTNQVPKDLE